MFNLVVEKRVSGKKVKNSRLAGYLPAVVYGAKISAIPISVSAKDFGLVFKKAGESSVVTLDVEGKKVPTLIHDVSYHPVSGAVLHADFLAIDIHQAIRVNVPLEFTGVAPAEKLGGVVVKVMHEVEVEGLPDKLPHAISVSLEKLVDLESQILVADLVLPADIKTHAKPNEVVAAISVTKEESDLAAEPVDLSKIEVEKRGKKEEEAPAEV